MRAWEKAPGRTEISTGTGRGEGYGRKARYPQSGNEAVEISDKRGQVPVSPVTKAGVMGVDDEDGEAIESDDGEGAIRLDAPAERISARPDQRGPRRLADPRYTI